MKIGNKVHSFGKRDQAIRRNPNVPVIVRGWLHKQVCKCSLVSGHTLQYNPQGRASAFQGTEKAEAQALVTQDSVGDFHNEEFVLSKCEKQGLKIGLIPKRKLVNGHYHHSSVLRL